MANFSNICLPSICLALYRSTAVVLLACGSATVFAESQHSVTLRATDEGAIVEADGKPFAEYLIESGHQPAIWPVIGPTGKPMTRSFPIGPLQAGEKDDHPHHRSLWFSHGDVNGVDFWNIRTASDAAKQVAIRHREFERMEVDGAKAVVVTANDWISPDGKVCEDLRAVSFSANEDYRCIDFSIRLTATEGELTLGDTKEGTLGVRVAGTMKVDAKQGGRIDNARGDRDGATWGRPAEWVNYTGPIQNEELGILVMQHPTSFRYPSRWHVRTYGLFAANPFGEREFPEPRAEQGPVTIAPGESIELHYRVLLHRGMADAQIERLFAEFSDQQPGGALAVD